MRGQAADAATFATAADLLLRDAKGFAHNAFKIDLARRAIVRTLTQAAQGHAAIAVQQENPVSVMKPYIGTPTSRVDGRAKVTGAAQYAGEFNVPDLAYGSVVDLDHSEGPHRAHRHQPGAGRRRRASTC